MLLELVIALIIAGALVYIVGVLPIDGTFKTIAKVVVIVVFAIYVIRLLAPMVSLP